MKEYSVVPDKDATGWFVKIEDVAPIELYPERDIAVEEAEKLAKANQPSKVVIMDQHHEVEEKRTFGV